MALIIEDRVMETSTSTGTGDITLAGAVAGFRAFDDVMADGDTCYYVIEAVDADGVPTGDWETGLGTFNDTDTLTRTVVSRSTNANAAVSFAAGTKRVALTLISATATPLDRVIHCYEEQPSGTAGGASVANTWTTRVLNTTLANSITGASLASNEITLPAGTYDVSARAPCFSTGTSTGFKLRLYDVTGATTLIDGTSMWGGVSVEMECHVQGRFTLSATSNVRLEMTSTASRATNGFGVNAGITGVPNHFSDILIRQVIGSVSTIPVNRNDVVQILVSDPNGAILTGGNGKAYYRVPSTLNGLSLVAVAAAVTTTSSSGNPTIQIHNVTQAADMLTTAITIDAGDTDSKDATTPAVIDTTNDDVVTGDMLRIDVDASGTGAKGLMVELQFA
jgi:hypothetical protein